MQTRCSQSLKAFQADDRGAVAILFGLMATCLLFFAGMALDFARIADIKNRVADAIDAASLAAGRALLDGKLSDAEIQTLAITYFNENVKNVMGGAAISAPVVTVNRETGSVNINVDAAVNMTLARLGGFDKVDVPVSSAAVYQQRDIEVGMALDITGSMNDVPSKGGKRKIDGLKEAFGTFADQLLPKQANPAQKVRIALAPYSAAVNLGSYSSEASAGRSGDNCVTERKSGAFSDADDLSDAFLVAKDGIKDVDPTEGMGGSAYTCPQSQVTALSNDHDQLVATVNGFQPGGYTAGHIGVQWAWNLVSDNWGKTWNGDSVPDPYSRVSEGKLLKAVVLMTDGIFNTAYHGDKASSQAIALCDAMKAKGVVVFAVAFDAPADAKSTLQSCSSGGGDYYADASNGTELQAAFSKFAGKLSELRLAK